MPKMPDTTRRILVIEDDRLTGESLVKQFEGEGIEAHRVENATAAPG